MTAQEPELGETPSAAPVTKPHPRRVTFQKVATILAAFAGVGAVLGGLTGYWSTYRLLSTELGAHAAPKRSALRGLSVAVLPFSNLSGNPSEDYFADGIVDNLTTDLSTHIAGLMVVGRGSAFTYKGKAIDPLQVGRDLGVRYLLEGSVRRGEDQVRVNAQLVEAESGAQIWAERFEGETSELVSLQDRLTARIANSLGAALIRAEARDAESRSNNPRAMDLVFRARSAFFLGTRSMPELAEAEDLYRRALELDPENADALIGVGAVLASRMFNFRYVLDLSQDEIVQTNAAAIAMLDKGLRLKPDSAIAHSYKGLAFGAGLHWQEALQEYDIAHSLDPNFIAIYNNKANAWNALGDPVKAIPLIGEAIRRSPLDPQLGISNLVLGRAYLLLGRWDQAVDANLRARALQTGFINIHLALAAAYAKKGDLSAAKASLQEALTLRPNLTLAWLRSHPFSSEPDYVRLADSTLYDGLHKAGLQ